MSLLKYKIRSFTDQFREKIKLVHSFVHSFIQECLQQACCQNDECVWMCFLSCIHLMFFFLMTWIFRRGCVQCEKPIIYVVAAYQCIKCSKTYFTFYGQFEGIPKSLMSNKLFLGSVKYILYEEQPASLLFYIVQLILLMSPFLQVDHLCSLL